MNDYQPDEIGTEGHGAYLITGQDSMNKKLTAKIKDMVKSGRIAPESKQEVEMYANAQREAEEEVEPSDGFLHDGEADADALASAGYGTDEDYGNPSELL